MVTLSTHRCLQSARQRAEGSVYPEPPQSFSATQTQAKLSFLAARREGQYKAGLVLQEEKDGVANTHHKTLLWLLCAITAAASEYMDLKEFFLMSSYSTDPEE